VIKSKRIGGIGDNRTSFGISLTRRSGGKAKRETTDGKIEIRGETQELVRTDALKLRSYS